MLQVWVAICVNNYLVNNPEDGVSVFTSRAGAVKFIRKIDPDDAVVIAGPETEELPPRGTMYWFVMPQPVREECGCPTDFGEE
jgi:hypothetical protein